MGEGETKAIRSFKSRKWAYAYRTSAAGPDERPADILHDFYIPVLSLSVRYDRVAGYFRSTSLAAASQGFSAFVAEGGRMRLVVGADLDPEDVKAVLQGHKERMAECLERELDEPETWPDHVRRGVELLCWMVARGVLEVRVAFRVHATSGRPLSFDSAEDGYVHEKWAIFTDEEGNRIYATGSLNESRTALMLNAENIDVHGDWWGEIPRARVKDAQAVFENLWADRNPHLKVMPLPDAVKRKLIRIGEAVEIPEEIDGSSAHRPKVDPPSSLERLRFAVVRDGPKLPLGRYVGIETVPFEPWPHQDVVARRLVRTWPCSYLLCDEVGLGKTIEAALAIRALHLSGLAKRILVAAPASLTRQWHRELESKFFLPFARALPGPAVRHEVLLPVKEMRPGETLYGPDLCIVSTGLLVRKERLPDVRAAENFDIVLVDEAHYARRKNPKNGTRTSPRYGELYKVLRDLVRKKAKSLWLATATPMQLDWIEGFDLMALTGRAGPFRYDPSVTWSYYEALGALVRGERIHQDQWEFLRRAIASLERQDPFLWEYLQDAVVDGRIRACARRWLERGRVPVGRDRREITRLIFSAAPLSRVMLRHTRPLLEIYRKEGQLRSNLAERIILPVPRITMTPLERRAYDELEEYCRDLTAQIRTHNPKKATMTSLGFFLSFLRLRFASSLFAIRETLRRRREKVRETARHMEAGGYGGRDEEDLEDMVAQDEEVDERAVDSFLKERTPEDLRWEEARLSKMLDILDDLSETPSKMKELLKVLNDRRIPGGRIRQTVIFTRFYDTLQDIVKRLLLVHPAMLVGTYSGQGARYMDPEVGRLRGAERDEIKHRFLRGEIDVLVCTDAAAEGLNLQTADLVINYDLPWNPMKVEQRIGRIDRIGQRHEKISVLNLCYVDSAEQIVYDRLLKRLLQAEDVVGRQQVSLLPVTPDEFADLAAGQLTLDELEARARERIALQRKRTETMEIPVRDLYRFYERLTRKGMDRPPPVNLDAIWDALSSSRYLRSLGCAVIRQDGHAFMALKGLDGIPPGTMLTADRDLYELGIGGKEGRLHFATYGDPVFDAVMKEVERFELPSCVVRLSEKVPGCDGEVAGYAVACADEKSGERVRLVTSWEDLEGLRLDESASLKDEDVGAAGEKLRRMAWEEFVPIGRVARVEEANERAAKAQVLMDFLLADGLLASPVCKASDNFWALLQDRLDSLLDERERLTVTHLPARIVRRIRDELLYDVRVPRVGDRVSPTAPIFAVAAAVAAACRMADAMKVKRSELTVSRLRERLAREIEKYRRRWRN